MKPALTMDHGLIPDRICRHGSRFRTCSFGDCIGERESIYLRATREGRRDSEPWPNSFGDISIAVDLTAPSRSYEPPDLPPYADPRGLRRALLVVGIFAALLILAGLALWDLG